MTCGLGLTTTFNVNDKPSHPSALVGVIVYVAVSGIVSGFVNVPDNKPSFDEPAKGAGIKNGSGVTVGVVHI